jgi:hypothetical protein
MIKRERKMSSSLALATNTEHAARWAPAKLSRILLSSSEVSVASLAPSAPAFASAANLSVRKRERVRP